MLFCEISKDTTYTSNVPFYNIFTICFYNLSYLFRKIIFFQIIKKIYPTINKWIASFVERNLVQRVIF